jgi:glycosyltransferase involved in cell wall biosynthesis
MNSEKVTFVIPTKNEEKTIGEIIDEVRDICLKGDITIHELIITDDSTDNTRKIASEKGAKVIVGGGKGLGSAMLKGLKTAARNNPDIIISIDADGQVDLNEINIFIKTFRDEEVDLVLGSRFKEKGLIDYSYPIINRFGTLVLSLILRRFTKLELTDSHGGIRAMSPHVVKELELIGTHTYVQESIIDARENGFNIIEIPSRWLKREHGDSRVVLSIPKYIFFTLPVLILRSGKHINYLFTTGIFLVLLALLDISVVLIDTGFSLSEMFDRQSFVLFFVLLSTGINLFLFGVVLELVTQVKRRVNE